MKLWWAYIVVYLSLLCCQGSHNKSITMLTLADRVIISKKLSVNAMNVVKAAFLNDYPPHEDKVNAYDFMIYQGQKGMDWWNFPWDLPSSLPEYSISFTEMYDLLTSVRVKKHKNDEILVSYGAMLSHMVKELTPTIINAHGGHLRVVKIIYCVRNFLSVAHHHNLSDDIKELKAAAMHLIKLYNNNQLAHGSSPYLNASSYKPKNIQGIAEDRTLAQGINELMMLTH